MSTKTVEYEFNLLHPPALTSKQQAELAALRRQSDIASNTSDIPELTDEQWQSAEYGRFYKPTKTATTIRIDSDVLTWLKQQGRGYQTRINAILRREMLETHKRSQTPE